MPVTQTQVKLQIVVVHGIQWWHNYVEPPAAAYLCMSTSKAYRLTPLFKNVAGHLYSGTLATFVEKGGKITTAFVSALSAISSCEVHVMAVEECGEVVKTDC